MTRDLEELRAKRIAADHPEATLPTAVTNTENEKSVEEPMPPVATVSDEPLQQPLAGDENPYEKTEETQLDVQGSDHGVDDLFGEGDASVTEDVQPPAEDGASNSVGLGIDTSEKAGDAGQPTNEPHDALDAFFDMSGNNNAGDSNLDFDAMDFALQDTDATGNNQTQDQSQLQSHEFDLSTFGDASQDQQQTLDSTHNNDLLDMSNAQATQRTTSGDQGESTEKQNLGDNIFDLGENANATDSMNLNFDTNMVGGDDSLFDDMFYNAGDDNNMGGGAGNSGEFDDAFFGLES